MQNPSPRAGRLSTAQQDALSVLVTTGGRVEAGKRRSKREPRAYVNQRAADSLVRLGLARCIDPDLERGYTLDSGVPRGMVCTYKYEATDNGRQVHQQLVDSGLSTSRRTPNGSRPKAAEETPPIRYPRTVDEAIARLYDAADDHNLPILEELLCDAGLRWVHAGCWTNSARVRTCGRCRRRRATLEAREEVLP
jgi:hypothetical protein